METRTEKAERRIVRDKRGYQILKKIGSSFIFPESRKNGRNMNFKSEEKDSRSNNYVVRVGISETAVLLKDWADYGKKYKGISEVSDFIRGNLKAYSFIVDEEVYEDLNKHLNNGSPLNGRMILEEIE